MTERIDMGINLFVRNWRAQHQSVTRRELRKLAAEVLIHHGLEWQGDWIEGQEPKDDDECGGCKTWGAKLCGGSCTAPLTSQQAGMVEDATLLLNHATSQGRITENGKAKETPLDPDAGRPRAHEPVSEGQTPGWGFA